MSICPLLFGSMLLFLWSSSIVHFTYPKLFFVVLSEFSQIFPRFSFLIHMMSYLFEPRPGRVLGRSSIGMESRSFGRPSVF